MSAQLVSKEVLNVSPGDRCKITGTGEVSEELCCLKVGLHCPGASVACPQAPCEGPQEQIVPRGGNCHETRLDAVGALC